MDRRIVMEDLPRQPSGHGGPDMFRGEVWLHVIARGEEPSRMRVNAVHFAPGARAARHAHAVGQTVRVTEGVGRIRSRGDAVHAIRPVHTIHTPPGEWHWHGAAPDCFMAHLAMWEAPAESPEPERGEQVSDEGYLAPMEEEERS
jgi:quercetin dioxygenase-like cupin family protein